MTPCFIIIWTLSYLNSLRNITRSQALSVCPVTFNKRNNVTKGLNSNNMNFLVTPLLLENYKTTFYNRKRIYHLGLKSDTDQFYILHLLNDHFKFGFCKSFDVSYHHYSILQIPRWGDQCLYVKNEIPFSTCKHYIHGYKDHVWNY